MVELQKAGFDAMALSILALSPGKPAVAVSVPANPDHVVLAERAWVAMVKLLGILKPPMGSHLLLLPHEEQAVPINLGHCLMGA
jgi:hypothetical protein